MDDAQRFGRVFREEYADLVRVEMIAVADLEREIRVGVRRAVPGGEAGGKQELVGMRLNIATGPPCPRVVEELRCGVAVERGGEGVEIALIPGAVGPAFEADPELVGRVACGHPLGFGNVERVEEVLQLRRRTFADADDADLRAFDQGHADAAIPPAMRDQARGHPPGGAAAEDDDVLAEPVDHRRSTSPDSGGSMVVSAPSVANSMSP